MTELLVLINGEPIRLPHRYHQKVGSAIARAFELSTQKVGTDNRWHIEDRDGEPVTPADKVGYMDQIWVSLAAGPLDGGDVIDQPESVPFGATQIS